MKIECSPISCRKQVHFSCDDDEVCCVLDLDQHAESDFPGHFLVYNLLPVYS